MGKRDKRMDAPVCRMRVIFAMLLLALAAQGQQQQRIAILGTEDDGEPSISFLELAHLTAKLREIASDILPKIRYGIMTQQSIVDRLGSEERAAKECREATCLADLGRKISADYIVQARIGRFGGNLTIKAELYDVRSSNLIASFTGDSKDVQGLLVVLEAKSPSLFKNMLGGITIEDSGGNLNITGAYKGWKLTINDKPYYSFRNRLSPGVYNVKLNHECYEDINFKVDINNGSNEIFDMARHMQLKQGILELSAEQGGNSVNKPVFADGKRIGETPFGGYVPLCSNVEIGDNREKVDVKLKYMEKVRYTHKISGVANYEQRVEARERHDISSQNDDVKFGLRAGFSTYKFSFGYSDADKGKDMGAGYGAGLVAKILLTNHFSFNIGFEAFLRELFSGEESMDEFAISIPVLVQLTPVENGSFYLAAGIQLDIPSGTHWSAEKDYGYLMEHRASSNLGLAFELGYMIASNMALDFRCVMITDLFEDVENSSVNFKDRSSLGQFNFGLTYFF
jgi:hypothetical protein